MNAQEWVQFLPENKQLLSVLLSKVNSPEIMMACSDGDVRVLMTMLSKLISKITSTKESPTNLLQLPLQDLIEKAQSHLASSATSSPPRKRPVIEKQEKQPPVRRRTRQKTFSIGNATIYIDQKPVRVHRIDRSDGSFFLSKELHALGIHIFGDNKVTDAERKELVNLDVVSQKARGLKLVSVEAAKSHRRLTW